MLTVEEFLLKWLEKPFLLRRKDGSYSCPSCGHYHFSHSGGISTISARVSPFVCDISFSFACSGLVFLSFDKLN